MSNQKSDALVFFGATGDLAYKKIFPALQAMVKRGNLNVPVVGVAKAGWNLDQLRARAKDSLEKHCGIDPAAFEKLSGLMRYVDGDYQDPATFEALRGQLKEAHRPSYYLAIPPALFETVVENIAKSHGAADARVIVEKPFGHDLASAVELNKILLSIFDECCIFRIDHFLGKEPAQNILAFRFANGIFEPIWNRNYIEHVQITAAETLGVEGRGPFYEKAGALRDVVQNHVMELLSFVAMEPPPSFEAESVRREKLKVWQAIPPIPILNTVRGQYGPGVVEGKKVPGYRDEERVNPESGTETYAAVRLEIENWRWAGVPFYLRAGKRLKKRATEVSIQFKQPPLLIFNRMAASGPCTEIQPNLLTIRIQPDEGISLRFGAKVPTTPDMAVCPVVMDFNYSAAFGRSTANGYERLLLDAMLGDQTLFAHRDGVETTWGLYTPILEAWAAKNPEVFPNYFAGKWGPDCADRLLEREGYTWRNNLGKPE